MVILVVATYIFIEKDFFVDVLLFGPMQPQFPTYKAFCEITQNLGLEGMFCFTSPPFELLNTKMAGQFTTHLWIAFFGGLVLSFPYAIWEIWRFIAPGLYPKERKASRGLVFVSSMLFFAGILFGYYLITPLSVQFLGNYALSATVTNRIEVGSFIGTVTSVTLSSGLLFELPVLVYFLSKAGMVTASFMKTYRRHAIVLILVLSAIITPPDVMSQILVALPIMLLYEVSIGIAKRQEIRRNQLTQAPK